MSCVEARSCLSAVVDGTLPAAELASAIRSHGFAGEVVVVEDDGEPVHVSDAVFAAVLAAGWREAGFPGSLPVRG